MQEDENNPSIEVEVKIDQPEKIESEIKDAIEENKIDVLIEEIKDEARGALELANEAHYSAQEIIERNKFEAQEQVRNYIEDHEQWKIQTTEALQSLTQILENLTSSTQQQPQALQEIVVNPQNEVVEDLQNQEQEVEEMEEVQPVIEKRKPKIRAI